MIQADTLYKNGTIIPMTGEDHRLEAVAVRDGRIIGAGSQKALAGMVGPLTQVVDLGGHVMLPGFYDGHSHFSTAGLTSLYYVSLHSAPVGTMTCIDDYLDALRDRAKITPKGQPILASGYDDAGIKEMRHPTRKDLDKVSTQHPIVLNHITAHSMSVNSAALSIIGIDRHTPDPEGGAILRDEAGEPTGVLEETAVFYVWNDKTLNVFGTPDMQMAALEHNCMVYASKGITTANEGSIADLGMYQRALAGGHLKIRVSLWFDPQELLKHKDGLRSGSPRIHIGGAKAFQDGSPWLGTAFLSQPYKGTLSGTPKGHRGAPNMPREKLGELVTAVHNAGFNMFIHCNGDAAIDDVLWAFEQAITANPRTDLRHVCIHAQTARPDQLEKMLALGVDPSFYLSSVYYFGEKMRNIFLGEARANRSNPIGSAMRLGLRASTHLDSPVQPQDPLLSIWAAVNRITHVGRELGCEECITPYQGLLANTLYPAWQNGEQDLKGTIEPGKYADFVVLEENPLTVDPMAIKNIDVITTIVGGEVVYQKG